MKETCSPEAAYLTSPNIVAPGLAHPAVRATAEARARAEISERRRVAFNGGAIKAGS